jgi:hypothetical protein
MVGHNTVTHLMMPEFIGGERDEFGKQQDLRLPLLLPTVLEGHPIASKSPLFGLPVEILGDIVDLIADDQTTLAALALVNSDCRQLARSCQFAHVCFDYSTGSSRLLLRLVDEARIRRGDGVPANVTRQPFLGSCIRSVTVRPRLEWVRQHHSDLYASFRSIAREQLDKLDKEATTHYLDGFRTPILTTLKHAMPNLEALSWMDRMCLDDTFFTIVTHLPIRHLNISRARIGEPYRLEPPLAPLAMPLESLSFGGYQCTDEHHKEEAEADDAYPGMSRFISTLLQRCSPTLRRLSFSDMAFYSFRYRRKSVSFGQEQIAFPRLRYLDLSPIMGNPDAVAWSSILSAPLRHLTLPFGLYESDRTYGQSLSTCQPFRDLETLVVPYLGDETSATAQGIIDFISRHPRLCKLSVSQGEPSQLIDSSLVPLIANGRWSNLRSLSLAWFGQVAHETTEPNIVTIAAETLATIGSIESLEQLSLSAGFPAGWRHQWLVDHAVVRLSLRRLPRLKRLAFLRDTYRKDPDGLGDVDVEGYYDDQLVTSADEDAHRERMIREANEYAAALQQLEWIYCGQWPMDIRKEQTSSGVKRSAMPLGESRDSCRTFLGRMFAMKEDE